MRKRTNTYSGIVNQKGVDFSLKGVTDLGGIGKIAKAKMEGDVAILIKEWGSGNNAPNLREELLRALGITGALINTKRNLTVGLGELVCYEETYQKDAKGVNRMVLQEIEMPEEIRQFYDLSGGKKYFRQAGEELFKQVNTFTEFIPDGDTAAKIASKNRFTHMKLQPSRFMRAEQMNEDGEIENYYWRGDAWVDRRDEKRKFLAKRIAAYNPNLPDEEQDPEGFIFHTGDSLFSDEYYFIPAWEGISKLLQIAIKFPDFHLANLKHGLGIRKHVEILDEYLDDEQGDAADGAEGDTPEGVKTNTDKRNTRKTSLMDTVNEFFSSEINQGKSLVSEYHIDEVTGNPISDIKINEIKTDLQDEALIKLIDAIYKAIMSAFQVHPTLANIETQGRLSSGTEMRNAYLMWIAIHASTFRDILLEPWYLAKRLNGWNPKIRFGFRDAVLTTLADEPTGKKTDTTTT